MGFDQLFLAVLKPFIDLDLTRKVQLILHLIVLLSRIHKQFWTVETYAFYFLHLLSDLRESLWSVVFEAFEHIWHHALYLYE